MKDLPLSKTYTVGSEAFSTVKLRDPMLPDYRELGDVYDVQRGIIIRDREAIFGYVDRLVTSPTSGALETAGLSLVDAMALERHVLDFFIAARASLNVPTNSSSGSAGTPATSTG